MKELKLLGKLVKIDECPVLLSYAPEENFRDTWDIKHGSWECKDGWLIGTNPENNGGILFSRESYDCDIIFSSDAPILCQWPAYHLLNSTRLSIYCTSSSSAGLVGTDGFFEYL